MTKKLLIVNNCALLFGLKIKDVILCGFKATCSLVNTGLTSLSADNRTNRQTHVKLHLSV